MWETQVRSLGREDPLEKEMATHSSTLAWKIPWMEKPSRLQSMGSQRIGHNWATSLLHILDTSPFWDTSFIKTFSLCIVCPFIYLQVFAKWNFFILINLSWPFLLGLCFWCQVWEPLAYYYVSKNFYFFPPKNSITLHFILYGDIFWVCFCLFVFLNKARGLVSG